MFFLRLQRLNGCVFCRLRTVVRWNVMVCLLVGRGKPYADAARFSGVEIRDYSSENVLRGAGNGFHLNAGRLTKYAV